MAEVNGRPFLAYLLDDLSRQGLETVILAVGYKHEVIVDYFGDSYKGLSIKYSIEAERLGTGGGIRQACELVAGEHVLVLNGDTYFQVDLQVFYPFFRAKNCDMVLALKEMGDFDRYGTVQLNEEGRVTGFIEKGCEDYSLINGGVYLFHKDLLLKGNFEQQFSFEQKVLKNMVAEKYFCGLAFDTYFIDIGIPQDYEQSQQDFARL
jgi:D-glycero-alpha-D-manno-heptose 1-phosphate guanylyltransferase